MGTADSPIGIFDSGLGGLTVERAIARHLPSEDTVYFGDMARLPYGTKSKAAVTRFSLQNARFLSSLGVKMIVVGCHTSSALALSALKDQFTVPVVGVIEPGCRAAVQATRNGKIGVIGTEATIASGAYQEGLARLNGGLHILSKACPLLVPLVEEGRLDGQVTRLVVSEYLVDMKREGVDTLILGCTHYPLLRDVISGAMTNGVELVDPAEEAAAEVARVLEGNGLRRTVGLQARRRYIVSDSPERLRAVGRVFLGEEMMNVEQIDIEAF